MKRLAIWSALSKKLTDSELKIVDSLKLNSAKTKELDKSLKVFLKSPKKSKNLSVLLVPAKDTKEIFRAAANIPKVKALSAGSLNVEDLLKYKSVLIDQQAVQEIK